MEDIKLGDCYEAAAKLILYSKLENAILVHGMVNGQGKLNGVKYGHAWVEYDDLVFDYSNGRKLEIPKDIYYHLGKINDENNLYYTQEETRGWILKSGTWGPWEMSGDPIFLTENIPEEEYEVGIPNVKVSYKDKKKLIKQTLQEGVTRISGDYHFDWEKDSSSDLMKLKFMPWHSSKINFNGTDTLYSYYYAYKINYEREIFRGLNFLKDLKMMEGSFRSNDINILIKKAILGFTNKVNIKTYDTIISPMSSSKILYELIKGLESKIGVVNTFTDGFIKDTSNNIKLDKNKFNKIPIQIKNNIIKFFKNATIPGKPFKMKEIKPEYRKFFKKFLKFNNKNQREMFNAISGKRVIVIDDYETSGTTIKEMVRLLSEVGAIEVIVFVLIKIDDIRKNEIFINDSFN